MFKKSIKSSLMLCFLCSISLYGDVKEARFKDCDDYSPISTGGTGVTGPTGPTGPIGPAGLQGAQGAQGLVGTAGTTGVTGATGATGLGATGPQGNRGATGGAGPIGTTGATGLPGAIGPIGITGTTGADGLAGDQGSTGPQGVVGMVGPIGLTGNQGNGGPQGDQGPAGTLTQEFPTYAFLSTTPAYNGPTGLTGSPLIYEMQFTNDNLGPDITFGPTGATGSPGPTDTNYIEIVEGGYFMINTTLSLQVDTSIVGTTRLDFYYATNFNLGVTPYEELPETRYTYTYTNTVSGVGFIRIPVNYFVATRIGDPEDVIRLKLFVMLTGNAISFAEAGISDVINVNIIKIDLQ